MIKFEVVGIHDEAGKPFVLALDTAKQRYSVINQLSPDAVKITYDDFVKIINDVCRNDWGILA